MSSRAADNPQAIVCPLAEFETIAGVEGKLKHEYNPITPLESPMSNYSDVHSVLAVCLLLVYLHACRALAVCAVITGFFGGVLTLIGMKCTKIGGSELANSRVTFAGAVTYLASGKSK